MVVQFVDSLETMDSELGPVFVVPRVSDEATVIAVLVRGLSCGWTKGSLHVWLTRRARSGATMSGSNGGMTQQGSDAAVSTSSVGATDTGVRPTLSKLLEDPKEWRHCCSLSAALVARSPSLSGRVEDVDPEKLRASHKRTATRLLAGLLLPLPEVPGLSVKRYPKAVTVRVAFVGVAKALLNDPLGWETAVVTQPKLAAKVGWSRKTANENLQLLTQMELIERAGSRATSGKYRLAEPSKERARVARRHSMTIDALTGEGSTQLADLILSVDHPAWSYSTVVDHGHWLTLVADLAGVEVGTLGVSAAAEKTIRSKLVDETLFRPGTSLTEILDAIAGNENYGPMTPDGIPLTPLEARGAAMDAWRAAAEVRASQAVAIKDLRSDGHEFVKMMLLEFPIPKAVGLARDEVEASEAIREWIRGRRDQVMALEPSDEFRELVYPILREKLKARKYEEEDASYAASVVAYGTSKAGARQVA